MVIEKYLTKAFLLLNGRVAPGINLIGGQIPVVIVNVVNEMDEEKNLMDF